MKQQTKKIVQFQSPQDVRPRRGASTRAKATQPWCKKKPAKFYRENIPQIATLWRIFGA